MVDAIQSADTSEATVITLNDHLDADLSPQLEAFLVNCKSPVNKKIYINLQEVPSITADGVRVLINATLHTNGNTLGLMNPNAEVAQLLSTVGLSGLVLD